LLKNTWEHFKNKGFYRKKKKTPFFLEKRGAYQKRGQKSLITQSRVCRGKGPGKRPAIERLGKKKGTNLARAPEKPCGKKEALGIY